MKAKRISKWPWMRHGKLDQAAMWWEDVRRLDERHEPRRCVVSNGAIMLTCQYAPWLRERPWYKPEPWSMARIMWHREGGAWRRPGRRWTFGGTWGDIDVIDVGAMTVQARYLDLVERLYPGCRWKVPKLGTGPARAYQDDRAVAAILPMSTDRYLRNAFPRLMRRGSQWRGAR